MEGARPVCDLKPGDDLSERKGRKTDQHLFQQPLTLPVSRRSEATKWALPNNACYSHPKKKQQKKRIRELMLFLNAQTLH